MPVVFTPDNSHSFCAPTSNRGKRDPDTMLELTVEYETPESDVVSHFSDRPDDVTRNHCAAVNVLPHCNDSSRVKLLSVNGDDEPEPVGFTIHSTSGSAEPGTTPESGTLNEFVPVVNETVCVVSVVEYARGSGATNVKSKIAPPCATRTPDLPANRTNQ